MSEIVSRPYTGQGERNHERIFGKRSQIDYAEGSDKAHPKEGDKPLKVIDPSGKPIRLSARTKNCLYAQAKGLKNKIKDNLCTKNECAIATEHNIQKMLKSEFTSNGLVRKYRDTMRLIGADPKDVGTERLRRRR